MMRKATQDDLLEIAKLHIQSYENHFLPKLGVKLLSNYYREFIDNINVFLVSKILDTEKINGLILGTPDSTIGRKNFVKKNMLRLLLKITLLCLMFDKGTYERIFNHIKSFLISNKSNNYCNTPHLKLMTLLSICVSNEYKGTGVSKDLITSFEQELQEKGYDGYLLTVHKTNERAIKFYEKIQMKVHKETNNEYVFIKLFE